MSEDAANRDHSSTAPHDTASDDLVRAAVQEALDDLRSHRRYCKPECANTANDWCADCWRDGGNPALYPKATL